MLLRGSIKESREREREKEGGKAAKKESTDMEDIGIDPKGRRKTKGDNDGGGSDY